MNRAVFIALLLVALVISNRNSIGSMAEDEIVFAVPGPGRITLGVFDKKGTLVRSLHSMDSEDAFRIGLNGYITKWDGLDDAGNKVPAGPYHLRGYLIGDVVVEGEAFHFNDWITSDSAPALKRILDFALLPGGDVILLGETTSGSPVCARFSAETGFAWIREWKGAASLLAADDSVAIVSGETGWRFLSAEKGNTLEGTSGVPVANPQAVAIGENALAAAVEKSIHRFSLPNLERIDEIKAPDSFLSLAARKDALLGSAPGGVWISQAGDDFQKINLPVVVESVSFAPGNAFWFCGVGMDPDATPVIGQADFDGNLLRAMLGKTGEPAPKKIRASQAGEIFAVLEEGDGIQQLRVLSRDADGAWTIEWERTIRHAPDFGFLNDEVVADAKQTPQQNSMQVRLEKNPLTGEKQTLTLRAIPGEKGTLLVTADGLPLVHVSQRANIDRIVINRGKTPRSLRLLQSDGAAVEEFLINGLEHILPLNAGQFEIK